MDCTSSTLIWRSQSDDTVLYTCTLSLIDYTIPAILAEERLQKEGGESGYQEVMYGEILAYLSKLPRR